MKELSKNELMEVDGGKVAYITYTGDNWAWGLCVAIYDAAASIRNRFGD